VQRNAMKSWQGGKNFLTLLKADAEVTAVLPADELEPLFDERYYLRFVDDVFTRLGLTESQWKGGMAGPTDFAPRSI
jgi:adenylosuccinate lyase